MNTYNQMLYAARAFFRNQLNSTGDTLSKFISNMAEEYPDNVDTLALRRALTVAQWESLNSQLGAVPDLDFVSMLTHDLSRGELGAHRALSPIMTGPDWLGAIQPLLEIDLAHRIEVSASAAQQLENHGNGGGRNELTIHQRHRLELWARGLVPHDLHAVTTSTTIQGQVLALPRWEFAETCAPGAEHLEQMFITKLPHLFWGDSTTRFAHLIAEQLAWVYTTPEPSEVAVTDAVYAAIQLALTEGAIALGNGDVEDIRPSDGLVFLIDPTAGTVMVDPEYANQPVQTIDPEAVRPHGHALAEAQQRMDQRLASAEQEIGDAQ